MRPSSVIEPLGVGLSDLPARFGELLPRRADLAEMARRPRRDVVAGVTVAVVALPLALAFGISSGLGAAAGLITAIVAGALAALFGGSAVQISGPTGAMTVVLIPIVAELGAPGVVGVALLAGAILVGLAVARAGRLMQYVPLPVVEGFTLGIAVIIGLQQVPGILGLAPVGGGESVVGSAAESLGRWLTAPAGLPVAVALAVAGSILVAQRVRPGLPVSLLAIAVATLVVDAAGIEIPRIGALPVGLPTPGLPGLDLGRLPGLVLPAVAVAALAALESLMSATVADGMRVGERHDPDRELFGQGVANIGTALFGGIPATAAIARTAVNVRAGATSRLAALTQAGALLLVVLAASGLVGSIPIAALGGVLVATAIQMVEVSSLMVLVRSTRGDAAVLVTTALATVVLDLVTAVLLGLIVAGAFALQAIARTARLDETPLDHTDHSDEERRLFDDHIVAYRLDGPLFFGAAHAFLLELSELSDVRVVILRMSRLAALDATGASILADVVRRLEGRGITVMISGARPEHARMFVRLGVYDGLATERHVFASTPEAIVHARVHAARVAHRPFEDGLAVIGPAEAGAAPR